MTKNLAPEKEMFEHHCRIAYAIAEKLLHITDHEINEHMNGENFGNVLYVIAVSHIESILNLMRVIAEETDIELKKDNLVFYSVKLQEVIRNMYFDIFETKETMQ